jgi:Ca-activated chloride channel homolog
MIWESPGYLWLLLVVFAVYFGIRYYGVLIRRKRREYFSDEVFAKLYPQANTQLRRAKTGTFYGALVFLIIALSGPKIGTEVREVTRQGIDIMVLLDVSLSMKSEDVRPNRLDKAKFEILRMLDRLRGDRVGLITFTGEAILLAPLTSDYSAFRLYLNLADPSSMPSTTTDFAAGMQVALDAFASAGEADRNTSRVLLILSDGEDHGSDPLPVLQQLRGQGVYVFTVGIGTSAGGTIPVYDGNTGRLLEYMRDAAGQVVTTRLMPDVLRTIADSGQGTYYEISRSSDGMDGFLTQIGELERSEFATQEFADYKDQYQWFAAIGFILLFISLIIPQNKPLSS